MELREQGNGVLMIPVQQESALVEEDGILVHTGKLPPGFDWDKFLDDHRELRIRELWHR